MSVPTHTPSACTLRTHTLYAPVHMYRFARTDVLLSMCNTHSLVQMRTQRRAPTYVRHAFSSCQKSIHVRTAAYMRRVHTREQVRMCGCAPTRSLRTNTHPQALGTYARTCSHTHASEYRHTQVWKGTHVSYRHITRMHPFMHAPVHVSACSLRMKIPRVGTYTCSAHTEICAFHLCMCMCSCVCRHNRTIVYSCIYDIV